MFVSNACKYLHTYNVKLCKKGVQTILKAIVWYVTITKYKVMRCFIIKIIH